jgi:hypothetical protein
MPYFETGTEVTFTAADKVLLNTKALQGQTIGVVGNQYIAANVADNIATALNNFTMQNLTDIAAEISTFLSNPVRYMKVSWNMGANNLVTDFVIGCVVQIGNVPNNGADLQNAVHSTPLGYITDAFPSFGYAAYIIGTPPVGTFHYKQTVTAKTDNWLPLPTLLEEYGTEAAAIAELQNKFIANIKSATEQAYQQQGITVNVISATVTDIHLEKRLAVSGLLKGTECRLVVSFEIVLDSNIAFQKSPIAPLVLAALLVLAKIIAIAIVVGITAYLIVEWLKAMTTHTYTSEQTQYGWVLNPNTGDWEWKATSTKTESGTNPDIGGIFSVGTIVIVIVIVAIFIFGSRFIGKGEKK